MKLQLNGEAVESAATTLDAFLTEQGYGEAKVATAVNGSFVPAMMRAGQALSDGDAIEVLAPMQGG